MGGIKKKSIHRAMPDSMRPLDRCKGVGLAITEHEKMQSNYFINKISTQSSMLEKKDMQCIEHGLSVARPGIGSIHTARNI